MKKYMIFGISIFICFITIFSLKINNKKFLENVCYIEYKMRHEKGIIEDEMTISDVDEFIKLVNNLDLKKRNESDSTKGWLISFDCFNEKREYMYNIHLIGNLFYIDETAYYVEESRLNQLHQFINYKFKK